MMAENNRESVTPVAERLGLPQKKLPAQIFGRYRKLFTQKRDYALMNEKARDSFGKKERDPKDLDTALEKLFASGSGVWKKNLMLAKLQTQWGSVVGNHIAQHTSVGSYSDGLLVITADSPGWATQLTYMVPQLKKVISQRLQGLPVTQIRVTGPQSSAGRHRGNRRGL